MKLERQDTTTFINREVFLTPQVVKILDVKEMPSDKDKSGKNTVLKIEYKGLIQFLRLSKTNINEILDLFGDDYIGKECKVQASYFERKDLNGKDINGLKIAFSK